MQKKQILVLSGLFCLLLLTGYLNYKFNNNNSSVVNSNKNDSKIASSELPDHAKNVNSSSANFFADFRMDREKVRQNELENLENLIKDENTDADVMAKAQEQKIAINNAMEKEVTLEGLLKSKGFNDVVVTIRENSINVVVDETQIDEQKAAQILDIVKRETGEDASNIKIMPKN